MRELNTEFLNQFVAIEKYIRNTYGADGGMTDYINAMKESPQGACFVSHWKEDLHSLIHIRHIRNQLLHEAGLDADLCTQFDYDWICQFYNRLLTLTDPLALYRKAVEEAEKQRREAEARARLEAERAERAAEQRARAEAEIAAQRAASEHKTEAKQGEPYTYATADKVKADLEDEEQTDKLLDALKWTCVILLDIALIALLVLAVKLVL